MFVPKLIVCLKDYSWAQFKSDFVAGLVVGLVALPLAMAFAIASGLPPERGLYTAIVAGFLISALGGSRVQIGGPTGAFVVVVSGIVAQYGYDGLAVATVMAGAFLILIGLSRLGSMVKFIPQPVITGFTTGIAVIIFSSQVKDFLGLSMTEVPADFIEKWRAYFHALPTVNPWSPAIALFTLALIAFWPKRWKRVPGPVVALVATSIAAYAFQLPVDTIESRFGGVPHGLPMPSIPQWSWAQIKQLSSPALTVALLAAIESLLSAVVADGMIGGRHKSNMELVAQGVANLASPLFGGIPATGAIARTATNIKNGGRTPVAGMVHAFVLLAILVAAGGLAEKIPLACLAGILVMVSYHMSEWRAFKATFQAPANDVLVLLITFLLTVFVDLTVAVEVGMVLAAFLFMKSMADITHVRALSREADDGNGERLRAARIPEGVEVFSIQGSFFFGAASKLLETARFLSARPRALILEMSGVLHMDATGLHVLEQIHKNCKAQGTRLVIAGIHAQPLIALERSGRLAEIGEENIRASLDLALSELAGAN